MEQVTSDAAKDLNESHGDTFGPNILHSNRQITFQTPVIKKEENLKKYLQHS